jgi:hypothetical protein
MTGYHPPAYGRRLNPVARPFRPSGSKADAVVTRPFQRRSETSAPSGTAPPLLQSANLGAV